MQTVDHAVRLTETQLKEIKMSVGRFDPEAQVYLFGSRTDMNAKGGDVDLLIVSESMDDKDRIPLKLALYDLLGEQKIDLIIARAPFSAFQKMVLDEGVRL